MSYNYQAPDVLVELMERVEEIHEVLSLNPEDMHPIYFDRLSALAKTIESFPAAIQQVETQNFANEETERRDEEAGEEEPEMVKDSEAVEDAIAIDTAEGEGEHWTDGIYEGPGTGIVGEPATSTESDDE